jgi:hypothetical protein
MNWRKRFIDDAADNLRFIGYLFLYLDAILLAAFTLWFTKNFVWFFACWLKSVLFDERW